MPSWLMSSWRVTARSSRAKSEKHCKQVTIVYSAIAICIAYDPSVKQEGFFSADTGMDALPHDVATIG
jgi:hypothetical protein